MKPGITAEAEAPASNKYRLRVGGRSIRLSNLDRVLYPETGFTKGDLIDYYAAIAPVMLPHLKGRPLTMRRFPDGVEGPNFWEKRCPEHRPGWVSTASIRSGTSDESLEYCVAADVATLIWVASLAGIEVHTSLAKAKVRQRPGSVVFDLDPGEPADVIECADVALTIRGMFSKSRCARERCSSTGARTPNTRPPFAPIRSGRCRSPRSPRRSGGLRSKPHQETIRTPYVLAREPYWPGLRPTGTFLANSSKSSRSYLNFIDQSGLPGIPDRVS